MSSDSAATDPIWIYHERQEALLCGQHALNNLLQRPAFTAYQLAQTAHRLDDLELDFMANNNEGGRRSADYLRRVQEGSSNVDPQGNFSIQVLKAALQEECRLTLEYLTDAVLDGRDITDMQGFICHKSDHWFAIRKVGGRYWNLNSTAERPEAVSHFSLATEMRQTKNLGYTVFAIPSGLSAVGVSKPPSGGAGQGWHRMADLLKGKSTESDPWETLQGRGMRLDGGVANVPRATGIEAMSIDGLTEDEQIALAMQQSMEPAPAARAASQDSAADYSIPDEPASGDAGACRIQIKLPDGARLVRKFLKSNPVGGVYAVVQSKTSGGRPFVLLAGFPPKDLASVQSQTIAQAGLAGESIQGRFA
jgi:ataxin-3